MKTIFNSALYFALSLIFILAAGCSDDSKSGKHSTGDGDLIATDIDSTDDDSVSDEIPADKDEITDDGKTDEIPTDKDEIVPDDDKTDEIPTDKDEILPDEDKTDEVPTDKDEIIPDDGKTDETPTDNDAVTDDVLPDADIIPDETPTDSDSIPNPDFPKTYLSAGTYSTCALQNDNSLYCFGKNGYSSFGECTEVYGTLGVDTVCNIYTPETPVTGSYTTVSSGEQNVCAIDANSNVFCWGRNGMYGNMGLGEDLSAVAGCKASPWNAQQGAMPKYNYYCPTPKQIITDAAMVSTGVDHACVLKNNGELWCWGSDLYGQLGLGDAHQVNFNAVPAKVDDSYIFISSGKELTCGIKTDNKLYCWGSNSEGQLGAGNLVSSKKSPTPILDTKTFKFVNSARGLHSCAITTEGELYCWGNNDEGQLGNGTKTDSWLPTKIGTDSDWVSVDTDYVNTCALKVGGDVYCWGQANGGRIGGGDTMPDNPKCELRDPSNEYAKWRCTIPMKVSSTEKFASVSVGNMHSCAASVNGELFCWGDNYDGQGGLGKGVNEFTGTWVPTKVGTDVDWEILFASESDFLADYFSF